MLDGDDFLKEFILGLAEAEKESRPRVGEVWRLKVEDPDVKILLTLKKWANLPKFIKVLEILPMSWGHPDGIVRGVTKEGRRVETDSFQFMYELYRPSVWERLGEDQP